MTMAEPLISVVVPCWNAGATISVQLGAIAEQVRETPVEIIVLDDCSDDDTASVAARWVDTHPGTAVSVLRSPQRGGPNRSRNVGALVARGQWIVFVDGDDLVLPGWLDAMVECLRTASDSTIVTGIVVNPDGTRSISPTVNGVPTAYGGNMAISRHALLSSGGFDESTLRGGTETEFVLRAQRSHGFDVVVCERAAIDYRYPTQDSPFGQRVRRELQRAKGQAYLAHRLREDDTAKGAEAPRHRSSTTLRASLGRLRVDRKSTRLNSSH